MSEMPNTQIQRSAFRKLKDVMRETGSLLPDMKRKFKGAYNAVISEDSQLKTVLQEVYGNFEDAFGNDLKGFFDVEAIIYLKDRESDITLNDLAQLERRLLNFSDRILNDPRVLALTDAMENLAQDTSKFTEEQIAAVEILRNARNEIADFVNKVRALGNCEELRELKACYDSTPSRSAPIPNMP